MKVYVVNCNITSTQTDCAPQFVIGVYVSEDTAKKVVEQYKDELESTLDAEQYNVCVGYSQYYLGARLSMVDILLEVW